MMLTFKIARLKFKNCDLPIIISNFWKLLNRKNEVFTNAVVCTICWTEVGRHKKPTVDCPCGECGLRRKNATSKSFLYVNLSSQLGALFNKEGISTNLQYPYTRIKRHQDTIKDVYDSNTFKKLSEEGQILWREKNDYSLAVWTNGVSPFISSKVGVWPVFVQVLELSPCALQRHSLLAAVCVGPRKPPMNKFLTSKNSCSSNSLIILYVRICE